jgi:hypothetical protein
VIFFQRLLGAFVFFLSDALSGNWSWVRAGAFDNGICVLTAFTFVAMIVNNK